MEALEESFFVNSRLVVRQKKEWVEIMVDFETTNKYQILSEDEHELGWVLERGGGFIHWVKRIFLRSHRPLEVDVLDSTQKSILFLHRKFFFFFSDLFVQGNMNQPMGSVHRRFGVIYKKYDLYDNQRRVFAQIKCPIWRLWTFPIYSVLGKELGKITKKWRGLLREAFTDADQFLIDMGNHPWTPAQKAVLFAAAISIDFDFFENNQGKSGGLFGS